MTRSTTAPKSAHPDVLFVAAEIAPWVKTGGLGDVASALPPALAAAGARIKVLVPAYPAFLDAFPNASLFVSLTALAPRLLPCRVLNAGFIAEDVELLLLDAPLHFARAGNAYSDETGQEWADNAYRYGLLSRVAAWIAEHGNRVGWQPDILHCNDWHTALAPAYLHFLGGRTPSLLTVHNLAFQGLYSAATLAELGLPERAFSFDGVEFHGKLSFLKAGLQCATRISTVSPRYAEEIRTEDFGCGLDDLLSYRGAQLTGILNGIDESVWNPATDPALPRHFDANCLELKADNKYALQAELGLKVGDTPLLAMISRMTLQKGSDLLLTSADAFLSEGAQLVILGTGDKVMEGSMRSLAARYPRRCHATIGYDEGLAHRIEAAADIFLMPSRFEPCGLNQMYSLRYGTLPVVCKTGGLADTVIDWNPKAPHPRANGFVFDQPDAGAFQDTVARALAVYNRHPEIWQNLQHNGMRTDFSWAPSARQYLELYRQLLDPTHR